VDYAHTSYNKSAIVHSGDVIDYTKRQGTHTIKIELKDLPSNVKTLMFTITAYTTTLNQILHPYILFNDPETSQELCRYQFEEKDTGDKTAVIMAKLFRPTLGSPWQVVAIGHLGYGRASDYEPVYSDIKKFL